MKIIIAPDKFKGSLSAEAAAETIAAGIHSVLPNTQCLLFPMADGGDGTLAVLQRVLPELIVKTQAVSGPLGEPRLAQYGYLPAEQMAVIVWHEAAGLDLVPKNQRNPLKTTSVGVGQLIKAAILAGAKHILLGLGGSATCDGGIGALSVLGFSFLNGQGSPVELTGMGLAEIRNISFSHEWQGVKFTVLCDVESPLLGEQGAMLYARQKGLRGEDKPRLKAGFLNFAAQLKAWVAKTSPKMGFPKARTGAAGGAGAGFGALLSTPLVSGAEWIAERIGLSQALTGADWVITGEGQLDLQSLHGKVPVVVSRLAQAKGIPTIALAGELRVTHEDLQASGIVAAFSIVPGCLGQTRAMRETSKNLYAFAQQLGGLLRAEGFAKENLIDRL